MISRMPHAFRIGPLHGSAGTVFIYAARSSTGNAEVSEATMALGLVLG